MTPLFDNIIPAMRIRDFDDLESLEKLVPAWDSFLAEVPGASVFSTWAWLAPWWRAFGAGQRLRAAGFFGEDERLAGLAVLSIGSTRVAGGMSLKTLRFLGDGSEDSDNLDILARPGREEAVAEAFLDWTDRHAKQWDLCELNTMPENSPVLPALLSGLERRGWTAFAHERPWSVVELAATWEEHLAGLSSKFRKNLGGYRRRLEERSGASFHKCEKASEIPGMLETLFKLHQARWETKGEAGSFSSPERRRFYDEMAREMLSKGRLEFWRLDLDGKTAATQFGMRYGDAVYQLQEGFDPAHTAEGVGHLLRERVLKRLIDDGVRRYDFLGGASEAKDRWGARARRYADIHFAKPSSRGSVYLRLRGQSRRGKEWLRARAPRRIWDALKWLKSKA